MLAKALEERMLHREYLGWLVDGRVGVLLCQREGTRRMI